MTIRHLKIFITIIDSGNMSKAAEQLYISQPSVSQAVNELEAYFQVKLFERLSKKLYLTAQGEKLEGYARHLLDFQQKMENDMRESIRQVELKIGATITAGTCFINEVADAYLDSHKGHRLHVSINNSKVIEEMIGKNLLDLAIIQGRAKSEDFLSFPIKQDELILIANPKHHFAKEKLIKFKQLNGEAFILREPGSGTRALFDNKCYEHNIKVDGHWICNSIESTKEAVKRGRGLSIISQMLVRSELAEGTLLKIPIEDMRFFREFYLIYHKNKFINDSQKEFIKLLY